MNKEGTQFDESFPHIFVVFGASVRFNLFKSNLMIRSFKPKHILMTRVTLPRRKSIRHYGGCIGITCYRNEQHSLAMLAVR